MSVDVTQVFAADDVADRECLSNPGYTWDFSTGSADSTTGTPTNTLTQLDKSYNESPVTIENKLLTKTDKTKALMKMSQSVTLDSSNDWTMEINAMGDGTHAIRAVFSTGLKFADPNSQYIYIDKTGDMFLCTYGKLTTDDGKPHDNNYVFYKVSNKDYKNSILNRPEFNVTGYHKYQMKCIDGVFSTWVDDEKIGDLCKSESSTTRSSLKSKIYTGGTGTPFGDKFKSMKMQYIGIGNSSGNPTYGLTATVQSLGIFHGHKYDNACDTDCNNEGCNHERVAPHRWDD